MNAAQPSAHVQHQTEWQKLAETPVSFLLSDVGSGPVPWTCGKMSANEIYFYSSEKLHLNPATI
jgi:hypothetical protein